MHVRQFNAGIRSVVIIKPMSNHLIVEEFASKREWPFEELGFTGESYLKDSWCLSRNTFDSAQVALDKLEIDREIINTLAVAGSLGRMEFQQHSDCDLLVFLQDDRTSDDPAVVQQMDAIWNCLQDQQLRLPKPWGIFAKAVTPSALLKTESLGDLNESRDIFGKRIQILLDCQPLWGEQNFEVLQHCILKWYATAFVTDGNDSQWRYLLTDLMRYYKSYSAWHQFKFTIEHDDSWFIRDAKLRSSRLLMYAGLLLQLGSLSRQTVDKVEQLFKRMYLTPLERVIASCMQYDFDDDNIARIMTSYDVYYQVMANADNRQRLVDQAPRTIDQIVAIDEKAYSEIDKACVELRTVVTQFILHSQSHWHPKFTENVLF